MDSECAYVPTIYFDCILDTFFLLDIVYTFFVGVNFMGQYYDCQAWVAKQYVTGAFVFDLITSIPVSYIELQVQIACARLAAGGDGTGVGIDPQQLRFVRALKPLRWFKLARVLKLRSGGYTSAFILFADFLQITPRQRRISGGVARVIFSIHIAACVSWLIRVLTSESDQVETFLARMSPDPDTPIDIHSAVGKVEAYVIAAYFTTTVFSTVGFGDITPSNTIERFSCMCLMLTGVLIFGTLLADLGEIEHSSSAADIAKLEKEQNALDLMHVTDVPRKLQHEVLEWIRFQHTHIVSSTKQRELLTLLPISIQQQLILNIHGKMLSRIPIFEFLEATDKDFLRAVWSTFQYTTYEPHATIIPFDVEASSLIVIIKGRCDVSLQKFQERSTIELTDGDFLGEYAILGDTDWGASMAIGIEDCDVEMTACAHTFVVCMELEEEIFSRVLASQSIQTQRMLSIFKRNRNEHRQMYFTPNSSPDSKTLHVRNSVNEQRKEITDFLSEIRQIHLWDTMANKLLNDYRRNQSNTGVLGAGHSTGDPTNSGVSHACTCFTCFTCVYVCVRTCLAFMHPRSSRMNTCIFSSIILEFGASKYKPGIECMDPCVQTYACMHPNTQQQRETGPINFRAQWPNT